MEKKMVRNFLSNKSSESNYQKLAKAWTNQALQEIQLEKL